MGAKWVPNSTLEKRRELLWDRMMARPVQVGPKTRLDLEGIRPHNLVPRVFVASSTESKKAAMAVKKTMDKVAEAIVWTQGRF